MQHEHIEQLMIDYISGHMNAEQAADFHRLLVEQPEYSQELVELKQIMNLVDHADQIKVPEPSLSMDQKFYAMLENHSAPSKPKTSWLDRIISQLTMSQTKRFATTSAWVFLGVFVGHYLHLLNPQTNVIEQRMAAQDDKIQALTVLSLLDMPSAQERLLAVNLVGQAKQPSAEVMVALIQTLKHDKNVNVRLEALDVLAQFSQDHTVREGLIQAIAHQESPLIQVALANLMRVLDEKQAIKPLQSLLKQSELLAPVKAELNNAVNDLI